MAMRKVKSSLPEILSELEARYGPQEASWPADPYLFLVWWHCGYPASDATCGRGWQALNREVGVEPHNLLAASPAKLAKALKPGGMIPELRAARLKEVAARVKDAFAGDLRAGLVGPIGQVRKELKKFPGIADPGTDRILLFAGIAPVAAVPSNCTHVLVRIQRGQERENYSVSYHEAQQGIEAEVAASLHARQRAYLLLKRHGQEICKRTNPKCEECSVSAACAFFAGRKRGAG